MAPRIPPSSLPPTVPQLPAQGAEKGDYTVQPKDTLWLIARRYVEQSSGQPASDAQVAKAVAAFKERNPHLCTPERRGGDLIRPGDPVFFPAASPAAGWGPAPQDGKRAGQPTQPADVGTQNAARAQAQQAETQQGIAVMKQVAGAVEAQLAAGTPLSANDTAALTQLLERFAGNPEVLASDAAKQLQQRIASATGAAPATVPAAPATVPAAPPSTAAAPPVSTSTGKPDQQGIPGRLASAAALIRGLGTRPLDEKDAKEINQLLLDAAIDYAQNPDFKFLNRALESKKESPNLAAPTLNTDPATLGPALARAAAAVRALGTTPISDKDAAEINQLLLDSATIAQLSQSADFNFLDKALRDRPKKTGATAQPQQAQQAENPDEPKSAQQFIDNQLKKNNDAMLEKSKQALDESRRE